MKTNVQTAYIKMINEKLKHFFEKYPLTHQQFHLFLTDIIIECFHLPEWKLSKEMKALLILQHVLSIASRRPHTKRAFNLTSFIKRYQLSQRVVKQLLTSLLYSIYFKGMPFAELKDVQIIEWLLVQILSTIISQRKLQAILKSMTISQHMHLLGFIFKHYRESSYIILQALKKLCLDRQHKPLDSSYYLNLLDLMTGLRSKVYEVAIFFNYLKQELFFDESALDNLLIKLKKHAEKEIKACFVFFNKLIPLIIDSPIRTYNSLKKMEGRNDLDQHQKIALEQQMSLQNRFQNFFNKKYTLAEFKVLFSAIGLYDQMPYIHIGGKLFLTKGHKDKIKFIYKIFENPFSIARLAPLETLTCISYALAFINHLEMLSRDPGSAQRGLDKLACAIATCGKQLAEQPSLESLLEGFHALENFLNHSRKDLFLLKTLPIFIYDQSETLSFEKNQKYIEQLNKHYKSSIIHLSYDQVIALSKKIGIEKLINASEIKYMGYGGSRNCVFLLTPLLKYLFKVGKKTFSEVEAIDNQLLNDLFHHLVLHNRSNDVILMIDDDMEIPKANIFSHVLFAEQCETEYQFSHGFCIGRATKYLNRFRDLQEILENPSQIFDFAQWIEIPFSIKMAEYIGKPKICLNLPLGQEEAHLQIMCVENPMLQISYHHGGSRYPSSGLIPSHFFIGLETHLKKNINYVLGISLSMDLIDPSNASNRCILPWNDKDDSKFKCLNDAFFFISKNENKQEMQKRFWKNVKDVFHPIKGLSIPLRQYINNLINTDVDAILKKFQKAHRLDQSEDRSLLAIGSIYKFYQQDANLFWEFGSELIKLKLFNKNVDIKNAIDNTRARLEKKYFLVFYEYPTTYHFFLMCHSLGAGEFGCN